MKKYLIMLLLVCSLFTVSTPSYSAEGTQYVDIEQLEGMSANARNEYIQAQIDLLKKKSGMSSAGVIDTISKVDPNKMREWGTLFGDAITAMCTSMNVEVNKFLRTPAGFFIAGVVAYKVAGDDLIAFINSKIFGPIGYVFFLAILWFSYTRFFGFIKLKTVVETFDDKNKIVRTITQHAQPRVEWNEKSKEAKITAACFHFGAMIIATIASMVIIL